MGLIFPSRRRRSGLSLGMMLLLACLIIGALFVRYPEATLTQCRALTASAAHAQSLCDGAANLASWVAGRMGGSSGVSTGEAFSEQMNDWRLAFDQSGLRERWQAIRYRLDNGLSWGGGENPMAGYVAVDQVRAALGGHGLPDFGSAPEGKLRAALTQYMAGQQAFGSDPAGGVSWYERGAATGGEYGILSQLKLGSVYMQGGPGIAPDIGKSYGYNAQALSSLQQLRASNSPEAAVALRSLPVEPGQLEIQLKELLEKMRGAVEGRNGGY